MSEHRLDLRLPWIAVAIVGFVLILAFGLRLYRLDHEPLHVDEIKQVQEEQASVGEVIELSYRHAQPPLDYLIGKAVVTVVPATDFWQRLPAAISGTAAVALLALVLFRAGMPVAAVVAGVLAAIHPLLVQYSQYARPYTLPLFLVMLTIAIYQHWRLGSRRWWTLVAFAVAASLAMLSRATMPMLALAVLGLIGLIQAVRAEGLDFRRVITRDPLATVVLPAAFLFVWVPSFLMLRRYAGGFLASDNYDLWGRLATSVGRIGEFGERSLRPTSLALLLVALAVLPLIPTVRRALATTLYIWVPLLATAPAFAFVHSLTTNEGQFFADRYMVFLPFGIAAYVGLAAEGIVTGAWKRSRQIGVVAAVATAMALALTLLVPLARTTQSEFDVIETPDWETVGRYIQSTEQAGDVIVAIDTRPFRRGAYNFPFMSSPRYYSGSAPDARPDEVVVEADAAANTAQRYRFVLFGPKLAPEAVLPEDWELTEIPLMLVLTTPTLESDMDREEAWWTVAQYIRGDVSVMTRIAGYALAQRWFGTTHPHPWEDTAKAEAENLGLSDLAEQWLDRTMVTANSG